MSTPFSSLLNGTDRQAVVAENDFFIAILESNPLALGHVVVVAKQNEDFLLDLPDAALANLLVFAKPLSRAMARVFPCQKVGIAVIGLETRHAHLHLVPLQTADDLNFTRPKKVLSPGEFSSALQSLQKALSDPHF